MSTPHQTVLLHEAVGALVQDQSGLYVDGTFGRGGHSAVILESLNADGRLIAVDKDPEAIAVTEPGSDWAGVGDPRFSIQHASFADLKAYLSQKDELGKVSGVLLDLGVSSPQLDQAERGFSFLQDGPLDMRMNPSVSPSAAQWIASASEQEMASVFKEYGEERFAKRIARAIVAHRKESPFETTAQLAKVVSEANPAWEKNKHPATRVFQAIRIFINNELGDLKVLLADVLDLLAIGGRLVVISFHSLEDRLVKNFMRDQARGERLPSRLPVQNVDLNIRMKLIGKAIKASSDEVSANPRARSAVMRIAERVA